MFKVRAIEAKSEQERLCRICRTEYMEDDFAYAAYDIESPDDVDGEAIGICQFSFIGECVIHSLSPADGKDGDEAMLILGFAVLEFLRRCGFCDVTAHIPEAYARRLGFTKDGDTYTIDLSAPRACGGH